MSQKFFDDSRRIGRITTAVKGLKLALLRFSGADHMNTPFEFRVECVAWEREMDADSLIGTHVTVEIRNQADEYVPIDGIVTNVDWLGIGDRSYRFGLTLRPWLFVGSLRRQQRIFHNKTVVQIVQEVLGEYNDLGEVETSLSASYPELEYTVQYRESDAQFVLRLLERFGISYHFRYGMLEHTMVLTDNVDAHQEFVPGLFRQVDGRHRAEEEHFWHWTPARRITTGAIRLKDYNFKTPNAGMETEYVGDAAYPRGEIESYDFPGDYLDATEGDGVALRRTLQERGQDLRRDAEGDVVTLRAGKIVELTRGDEPQGGFGNFLCLSTQYSLTVGGYTSGVDESEFVARYRLMPVDAPLAPERKTPLAIVQGPQTAKVVGEGEIDCDEYGRILVQFHWDLAQAYSMRCRVSQNWAGAGWGGMVIPRIGMEVLVEFIEGNPDQPLVTGCVYNGANPAPYQLPAHKTKSVLRSDTHTSEGYNEISFEDEAGEENLFMHAQKDMTTKVLNNQSTNVLANRVENIGANTKVNIGGNRVERVGGSHTQTVGGGNLFGLITMLGSVAKAGGKFLKKNANGAGAPGGVTDFAGDVTNAADEVMHLRQGMSFASSGEHVTEAGKAQAAGAATIGGALAGFLPTSGVLSTFIEKFHSETIGMAKTEQVGAARNLVVGLVNSISVGKKMNTLVGEDYELEAKTSIFSKTTKHTIMAMDKITLGAPGGTIIIDQSGVKIKGIKVEVLSPSVDFKMGMPDQVQALSTDKPFAEKCPNK